MVKTAPGMAGNSREFHAAIPYKKGKEHRKPLLFYYTTDYSTSKRPLTISNMPQTSMP